MKQAEDRATLDWVGGETGNGGGMQYGDLLRRRAQLEAKLTGTMQRGAYRGAVKIGCVGHSLRARTGLSQTEFARRAGVSERSLRTWEAAQDPAAEAPKVHAAIVAALAALGVTYAIPNQWRAVRYRDPLTGDTWSGRGLQPAWLRAKLQAGARLADFDFGLVTGPDPHRASINATAQRAARAAGLADFERPT